MGYFQNIIDRVKTTITRIKTYLTGPNSDQVRQRVRNGVIMVVHDIRTTIMRRCYNICINKISIIIIFYIASFVNPKNED